MARRVMCVHIMAVLLLLALHCSPPVVQAVRLLPASQAVTETGTEKAESNMNTGMTAAVKPDNDDSYITSESLDRRCGEGQIQSQSEECITARILAAHTDYIYTQSHSHP